jgi:cytochrome c-type biogenesis protein CcmF
MGIALAVWLASSVLVTFAERVGLGRIPLADSLRRIVGLPRNIWGMTLAHFGFAIIIVGITGASLWQSENVLIMRPGETAQIAGYSLTLERIRDLRGPNYMARRATFVVHRDGEFETTLEPERRSYLVQGSQTTEAAIYSDGFADLYAVVGEGDSVDGVTVRLFHKPLIPWLWLGMTVMVAGGLMSLTDRRLRVGAPARKGRPSPLHAAAGAE